MSIKLHPIYNINIDLFYKKLIMFVVKIKKQVIQYL